MQIPKLKMAFTVLGLFITLTFPLEKAVYLFKTDGLLQPQDRMSRHRGAKPRRLCGLLGAISLLSPE